MTKREAARYPCDWTGGMLLAIVFLMEWEGVNAPVSCSASTAKLCSIHILRILLLSNLNLAHFHSLESILVAFRRHAGAEGGRDADRELWKEGLQQQGVGNDADVCADTNELCGFQTLGIGILLCYFRVSSTGQWSEPKISVWILASSSRSFRRSETRK